MYKYFDLVKDYVDNSYHKTLPHFVKTVSWVNKLHPNPPESLLIAAYGHDIERAFRGTKNSKISEVENYRGEDFLKYHQEQGAKLLAEFLETKKAPQKLINEVVHLVSKHEVGGDSLQNILMNADSASFFETNVENFVLMKSDIEGYDKVKEKIDWMLKRMTILKAKKPTELLYKKWISELNSKFNKN